MHKYTNRQSAGKILAQKLLQYKQHPHALVLALPRGGLPVAHPIAKILELPLDLFMVRKLGVPHHIELAMGAIASGNIVIFNEDIIKNSEITQDAINKVIKEERLELARRDALYRHNQPFPAIENKIIILVDDGVATGATIRAAIQSLKTKLPAKIVLTVPVAAASTYEELKKEVDEIICPLQPVNLQAVGHWYEDFTQTSDEDVARLLADLNI